MNTTDQKLIAEVDVQDFDKEKDIEAITPIFRDTWVRLRGHDFKESDQHTMMRILTREFNENAQMKVIRVNNKVVAFIIYYNVNSQTGLIYHLAVHKDYLDKFYEESLIRVAERYFKDKKLLASEINVFSDDSGTMSLYDGLGYTKPKLTPWKTSMKKVFSEM